MEFVLFGIVCDQVKRQQKNRICMYTEVNDGFQSVSKLSKVKDGEIYGRRKMEKYNKMMGFETFFSWLKIEFLFCACLVCF